MSKRSRILPEDPPHVIVRTMGNIYRQGMTTISGGNLSVKDENGNIWITPTAIDKGSLRAADITCVHPDGTATGRHRPSSEYPLHKAVYDVRPDLKALIHAHPPALVSFSIAHRVPDTAIMAGLREICGPAGYSAYELPGSEMLGEKIASEFRRGYSSVIMENHAATVGGTDLPDALRRLEALEFCARTIMSGEIIGRPLALSDDQMKEYSAQREYIIPQKKSVQPVYGEEKKRGEICRFVQRAWHRELLFSSCGSVSARLGEDDFLVTPGDVAVYDLHADDIVRVSGGRRESGRPPDRYTWLHQQVYLRHPHINSIIFAQPPYLMAFGVTDTRVDVRTIPESWIFLQDIPSVPFGSQFRGHNEISDLISLNTPALMIRNDSVLSTGESILKAFDRLEIAELTAMSLVLSRSLGKVTPINDRQIEELRKAFLKP
jgi:L-fuculose-phosphate aldolase